MVLMRLMLRFPQFKFGQNQQPLIAGLWLMSTP